MAIDVVNRWQLIREVILQKKTGAIVLQTGRNYIHWIVERGKLVCVSSTLPEASLTQAIQQQNITEPAELLRAQAMVDERKPLGAILLQRKLVKEETLQRVIWQHWIACTDFLFEPSMHLFWSMNSPPPKPETVRYDRGLSEVLLHVNRNTITIPTALRTVQNLKTPYRLAPRLPDVTAFSEEERRIWMHLQSGSGMKEIMRDADVTRISCYKALFLLWVTGHLSDSTVRTVAKVKEATKIAVHRIPAEWIFPLCAGALIGVLLAPSDPPKPPPKPTPKVQRLHDSPAWSVPDQPDDPNLNPDDTEK
jgi:hypothetical protein